MIVGLLSPKLKVVYNFHLLTIFMSIEWKYIFLYKGHPKQESLSQTYLSDSLNLFFFIHL